MDYLTASLPLKVARLTPDTPLDTLSMHTQAGKNINAEK